MRVRHKAQTNTDTEQTWLQTDRFRTAFVSIVTHRVFIGPARDRSRELTIIYTQQHCRQTINANLPAIFRLGGLGHWIGLTKRPVIKNHN